MSARPVPWIALSCGVLASLSACGGRSETPTATEETPTSPTPSNPSPSGPLTATSAIDAGGQITALTTPNAHVCWTSFLGGPRPASLVACVSKSDGQRVEYLRDSLVHPALAVVGDEIFWSTEKTATIDRAPLAGGAPTPFVTKQGPHGRFVVARSTFYWMVAA